MYLSFSYSLFLPELYDLPLGKPQRKNCKKNSYGTIVIAPSRLQPKGLQIPISCQKTANLNRDTGKVILANCRQYLLFNENMTIKTSDFISLI
jgi:hypothetical protein